MRKTALVLSGGGSRGAYEIGVWKALKKLRISIDMVFGTSVGAINGAMIAQKDLKLSEKLWQQLETDMIFDVKTSGIPAEDTLAYAKEIVAHGGAGTSGLSLILNSYINESKIRRSSVDFGLVVTEFPSFEGRFLYKDDIPRGQLIDYIMASASCFPAVRKFVIDDSKLIDGGYKDNLPVEMALNKNADRIIAVDLQAAGIVKHSVLKKAKEQTDFYLIKSSLALGNFLIFDKLNTARIMRLGYLETMRCFEKYDGIRYTFKKHTFTPHQLIGADNAAYILGVDPCHIYDKATIITAMKERLNTIRIPDNYNDIEPLEIPSRISALSENIRDNGIHARFLIHIAKDLKKKQENSLFLQPALFNLLENEVQAANFLVTYHLI